MADNMNEQDVIYFVSYYTPRGRGMGNTEAVISGEIVSLDQVMEIEKMIEQEHSLTDVTIINFFPLRMENPDSEGE